MNKAKYVMLNSILFIVAQCQIEEELNLFLDEPSYKALQSGLKSASVGGQFTILSYNIAGLPEPFSRANPSVNTPLLRVHVNDYHIVQVQEDFNCLTAHFEGDLHHSELNLN